MLPHVSNTNTNDVPRTPENPFGPIVPAEPSGVPLSPLPPRSPTCTGDVRTVPLPGIRCPTCAADGREVWVLPGRACGYCGTPCW